MLAGWIVSLVGVVIGVLLMEPVVRRIRLGSMDIDGLAAVFSFAFGLLVSIAAFTSTVYLGVGWIGSIFLAPIAGLFIYTIGIRSIDSEVDLPKP